MTATASSTAIHPLIVLAGANGELGSRIANHLLQRKARVRLLVRSASSKEKLSHLAEQGAEIVVTAFSEDSLVEACQGASCVVSALSGLEEVVIDAQSVLLSAVERAGVSRFIPSDFAIDFTKITPGSNRNLDLRRRFKERVDASPVRSTSILNGAFSDMLTGLMPLILFPLKRVVYFENADQKLDLTSMETTAAYTAAAALDDDAPRFLRIAADELSAREVAQMMTELTGEPYKLLRGGSLKALSFYIRMAKTFFPQKGDLYPAWQGMQYFHSMFGGKAKLAPLDNDRYSGIPWVKARDILKQHVAEKGL
jgi:nucleoside-diphosphate-sugar epimerase